MADRCVMQLSAGRAGLEVRQGSGCKPFKRDERHSYAMQIWLRAGEARPATKRRRGRDALDAICDAGQGEKVRCGPLIAAEQHGSWQALVRRFASAPYAVQL
ncbi:MAG: hypothetical protein ACREPE_05100 [Lysobacter sp.]